MISRFIFDDSQEKADAWPRKMAHASDAQTSRSTRQRLVKTFLLLPEPICLTASQTSFLINIYIIINSTVLWQTPHKASTAIDRLPSSTISCRPGLSLADL